jgi:hypothetical protein
MVNGIYGWDLKYGMEKFLDQNLFIIKKIYLFIYLFINKLFSK